MLKEIQVTQMWSSTALFEGGCVFPDRVRSMPEYLTHCLDFLSAPYALCLAQRPLVVSLSLMFFSPTLSQR